MLLRQPGSPGPSILFFLSTAARTAVGIPGSAEELPEDSGSPGRDLFAGEELRTYLERRLGGLHPDDASEETKVIDVTGPGGECLQAKTWRGDAAVTRRLGWSNTRRLPGSSLPEM